MKQLLTALIVVSAAALSGSAVAKDIGDNARSPSSADSKSAALGPTSPQAEPEEDPEIELMTVPEEPSGPTVKG